MNDTSSDKKYSGIRWAIGVAVVFVVISLLALQFISGSAWYVFSSMLRFAFGIFILLVAKNLYDTPVKDVLRLSGSRKALLAGSGFLLFFLYYIVLWCSGFRAITGLTTGLLLSRVILQQIATGFYEELNYRFLVLKGYFYGRQNGKSKLLYAFASFLLFGAVHVVDGWSTYRFLQTGIIGFAFAVMYLKSGNIVVPMILHFVYDVFANLTPFITWNGSPVFTRLNAAFPTALAVMFVISLVTLLLPEHGDKAPKAVT